LFSIMGFAGWQSARLFSDGAAPAADTAVYGVKAARTVRIPDTDGPVVGRTRTVTLPGQGHTVVVVKGVTRLVPTTTIRNGRVIVVTRPAIVKTVTNVHAQTVVTTRTVTQRLDHPVTVMQTQTESGPLPPGHARTTVTVTVTVTQAATTVTVTTSKGH
jgi:hypothetical protein